VFSSLVLCLTVFVVKHDQRWEILRAFIDTFNKHNWFHAWVTLTNTHWMNSDPSVNYKKTQLLST